MTLSISRAFSDNLNLSNRKYTNSNHLPLSNSCFFKKKKIQVSDENRTPEKSRSSTHDQTSTATAELLEWAAEDHCKLAERMLKIAAKLKGKHQ
jgi:hypothetical protein